MMYFPYCVRLAKAKQNHKHPKENVCKMLLHKKDRMLKNLGWRSVLFLPSQFEVFVSQEREIKKEGRWFTNWCYNISASEI